MTSPSEQAITRFLDCWHRRDLDALAAHLHENAVFQPDPKSPPIHGREAIRALWGTYLGTIESYDADVRAMGTGQGTVFVERVERLALAGGRSMSLPIVAVFEVDDHGLILAWRDYWDTAMAPQA